MAWNEVCSGLSDMSDHRLNPCSSLLSFLTFASSLLLSACGGAEELPEAGAWMTPGALIESVACEEGESRVCGVTLEQEGPSMSCFRGVSHCETGVFGPCTEGIVTREPLPQAREVEGHEILSISQAQTCDDPTSQVFNPCDPGCHYFAEDPPDITTGSANPPAGNCGGTAIPGLCEFGIFSDGDVKLANRSSSNARVGAYGSVDVGTDASVAGIVAQGDIVFPSLNGKSVDAPLGIRTDASIISQNSNSLVFADLFAGDEIRIPAWRVQSGFSVNSENGITGQNGTLIDGDANTAGAISGAIVGGNACHGQASCYTHEPVSLPPRTGGTAIPTLATDCSGSLDVSTNGGSATVPGPGTYRQVSVSNGGTLVLHGEGTYYFKSLHLHARTLVLEPDQGGTVGWDIRVCDGVEMGNDLKVQGGTGLANDSAGVLRDGSLLRLYSDHTSTINIGVSVYFSGLLIAPNARVKKGNVNSPPSQSEIASGQRTAPLNGAVWAKEIDLGTDAMTTQVDEAACLALNIPGTAGSNQCSTSPSAPVVQTHSYQATCPAGAHARWGRLAWDTDTSSDAEVRFELAPVTATGPANFVATGTATAGPQDTQSCSLLDACAPDITGVMGWGDEQPSELELRVSLEPNSGDATLYDWKLTYSCVYDE